MNQKREKPTEDTMRDEYDFTGGVRGKYAARLAESSNIVLLDEDVSRVFPDSRSVNEALRELVRIAERCGQATLTPSRAPADARRSAATPSMEVPCAPRFKPS